MPTVLKTLNIAKDQTSKIWDYRNETPPNGGRIDLQACVHHIPVIADRPGRDDLDLLRDVLIQQGLMVQFGTDAEGNVALYTRANRLCYHAKGANSVACGIEHMHYSIDDPWTEKQLRAAGWIAHRLVEQGIPLRMADVEPAGPGRVKIVRTGHTTHQQVSRLAGSNDRRDPGSLCNFDRIFHYARFYKRHGHFVGA
jgi:hypothetical protein